MNLPERLHSLATVSTGSTRAMFESATAAYHAIFEGEEDELAELSELGNEIGGDLDAGEDGEDGGESAPVEGGDGGDGASTEGGETEPNAAASEAPAAPEEPAPEQTPEQVNEQSQPASISADALIKELIDLKYPEKIRVVAQQMKQSSKGAPPTANDMIKPVAEAISKYMAKKGYAAMQKDEAIRVVKTIIMAATDTKKPSHQSDEGEQPQETENAAV